MKYNPPHDDLLCAVTYGSHLYGTSNPKSDHDFKAVYLPSKRNLLLGKKLNVLKFRFDADGKPVGDDSASMPDNGYEAEHTPVQKFVHDWLGGQAYAVEVVFAVLQGYAEGHAGFNTRTHFHPYQSNQARFVELCETLVDDFRTKNLQGMTGFAMKQTFDYVRRGERLNSARAVLDEVVSVVDVLDGEPTKMRLDSKMPDGKLVLDHVAFNTGLETGKSHNGDRVLRTLKLNGREYLETTTLVNFKVAVEKLVDQYGERSTRASETDVDWKSLSHAVRVYQQVLELLDTGWLTFPRPNADFLLKVRMGELPLEQVKTLLSDLDDQVQAKLETSSLPDATPELYARLDNVLYDWLEGEY